PAADRLAIALDAHRTKCMDPQGRCRRSVDQGLVEVAPPANQRALLCAERGKRLSLLVPQLTDVERGGEIARGIVQQRGLARGVGAPIQARSKARLAVLSTFGREGHR